MKRLSRIGPVCLLAILSGCARDTWPDPPPIDQAKYQKDYADFLKQQEETAAFALPIIGAWPLPEGDTPFGADTALPIVLPAKTGVPRAGVFRRTGETITVRPAPGAPLTREDGRAITTDVPVDPGTALVVRSVRLEVINVPPEPFVSGRDNEDPSLKDLHIEAYPVESKWRVAARFDAFEKPRPIRIATTRGGFNDTTAPGQLVFRLRGQEYRLTALADSGSPQFFVMFKDETNGKTTFSGYRMLSAAVVPAGGWTVLDFNLASNPPCAYSRFTLCPLPPKENRLPVAVEAGVKRHPTARGFAE